MFEYSSGLRLVKAQERILDSAGSNAARAGHTAAQLYRVIIAAVCDLPGSQIKKVCE